jgi:HrpA-like RNA helicase
VSYQSAVGEGSCLFLASFYLFYFDLFSVLYLTVLLMLWETGCHLAQLPVDPKVGKMLLMGAVFQCMGPALTIAAALAHRDPFVLPIDRKEDADEARRYFAGDSQRYL